LERAAGGSQGNNKTANNLQAFQLIVVARQSRLRFINQQPMVLVLVLLFLLYSMRQL